MFSLSVIIVQRLLVIRWACRSQGLSLHWPHCYICYIDHLFPIFSSGGPVASWVIYLDVANFTVLVFIVIARLDSERSDLGVKQFEMALKS